MKVERYAEFVKIGNFTKDERDGKFLAAMGLAGEAGEACDMLKKHLLHGDYLDRDALRKELGDVMWYLQHAMNVFGFTDKEVREANVAKLCDRYPEGYGDLSKWLS
jgi:NTP pyrophosphatase (non-canonical NTP hydrolase)